MKCRLAMTLVLALLAGSPSVVAQNPPPSAGAAAPVAAPSPQPARPRVEANRARVECGCPQLPRISRQSRSDQVRGKVPPAQAQGVAARFEPSRYAAARPLRSADTFRFSGCTGERAFPRSLLYRHPAAAVAAGTARARVPCALRRLLPGRISG